MIKRRRHERLPLLADMTIQPGDVNPARFSAQVFNVSASGAALFSRQYFPPGKLAGMEIALPCPAGPPRKVRLLGVVRRVQVQDDGNILGIEFVPQPGSADYDAFIRTVESLRRNRLSRPAFTLVEACIAMSILCLLVTLSAPIYVQALEQAAVDNAAANLRTIWSAQRVYWLEHRTFASSLGDLAGLDLLDPSLAASPAPAGAKFVYQISSSSTEAFHARAVRIGSAKWTGQLYVDETGLIGGQVRGESKTLVPPS